MTQANLFIGIDVAKTRLDIAVRPTGQQWHVDYTEDGVKELAGQIGKLHPTLVLLEATGGLEVAVVAALAVANLPVVVVNPRQVRDFARATGKLAKTDALDALVLAQFAEAVRPVLRPLPDTETQSLAALVARRNQVMGMLARQQAGVAAPMPSRRPQTRP